MGRRRIHAFTLVEILSTIVIIGLLATLSLIYIPNYITQAQTDAQNRQLATLNRAIEEYRVMGGLTYAHSLQGPNTTAKITSVVNYLKTGFTADDGKIHNFLPNLGNLDLTKLSAIGQGHNFIFNSVTSGPAMSISLSGNMAFGNVVVNATSTATLTIQNTGGATITVSSISYPAGYSGAWSGSILAGASQNVTVTFAPTSAISYNGTITANSNATSGSNTISATGAGIAGRVIGLTGSMAFGDVAIDATSTATLTIQNTGAGTLTVDSISYPAGYSGDWSSGSIAPSSSQDITVTFAPTSETSYNGTISVSSDATSGTNTIAATGNGEDITSGLQLYYSLNDTDISGTTVTDLSGNGDTGTTVNSPISIPGETNQALTFDGASQYITGTSAATTVLDNWTMSAWINPLNLSQIGIAVSNGYDDGGSGNGYAFGIGDGSGTPGSKLQGVLSGVIWLDSGYTFPIANQWYHVVMERSSGTIYFYVNAAQTANTFGNIPLTPTEFRVGSQDGIRYFAGAIQEVRVYNRALSADEISALYHSSLGTGPTGSPAIALSGNMSFGSVLVNTSSSSSVLTISNTGTATMTVSSIDYPSGFSGDWASGIITPGNSQNVNVTFSPTAETSYSGNITVNSDATSGTNTIAASGTGVEPDISLIGTMDFGTIALNTSSSPATLTIYNTGSSTMSVTSISYPTGFSGDWSSSGGTIGAGSYQNIAVYFSPTILQSYSGNITVNCDSLGGTNTIAVTGTGGEAYISLSGLTANFNNVLDNTNSSPSSLTISNTGSTTMTVSSISYPTGFSGDWSSGTIAAGGSQNVNVSFSPTSEGSYGGTVTVNSDALGGTNTISTSGTGVQPDIGLSGSLDFGTIPINTMSSNTLTIANLGSSTMTVSSISYPGGFSGDWSGGTIAAGGSQNVNVTFTPSAVQFYGGNITVYSDALGGSNTISTTGTGGTPGIALSGNMAFGNIVDNTNSAPSILTISNTGTTTMTVSSISYPTGFSGDWSGGTIIPGSYQNVNVTFTPTAESPYSGTITVNCDATSGTNTTSASGTGVQPDISLSGTMGFGNVTINTNSSPITLTISNAGSSTMNVSSISYPTGFSGDWPNGTISAGGSQNVNVTFSPTQLQDYSGNITVNSDSQSGTNTIAATGTGGIPDISLSGNMSFGNVLINTTPSSVLTISNTGNTTMIVSSISYPTGFSGDWGSGTIAPSSSQDVNVTFSPIAETSYSGNISVTSNATGTNTIAASGTGVQPDISLSGNMSFGNIAINSNTSSTLTISNTGGATMTVSSISYPTGFSGDWGSGTIAAGGSQNVNVTFAPTAETSYSGNITVNSDATGTNTIAASGSGAQADVSLSGNMSFGNITVNSSTSSTLTISNTGGIAMNVSSISYPAGFSGDWASGSIAAGSSQNVNVSFAPTAETSYSGTITVNSDASGGTNTTAASGTGVEPDISLSLANFGNVLVNTTASQQMTISNTGTSTMTVSSISYPTGFSGDWGIGTIAAGSSQNVNVTFAPTAETSYSGNVTVTSDAQGGTNSIGEAGTGVQPDISLSGSLDFGNVTANTTASATMTISNTGSSTMTVSSISYPDGFSGDWSSGTIAAGGSQNVNVTFAPTDTIYYSGGVTVFSDSLSGTNVIGASGTGD